MIGIKENYTSAEHQFYDDKNPWYALFSRVDTNCLKPRGLMMKKLSPSERLACYKVMTGHKISISRYISLADVDSNHENWLSGQDEIAYYHAQFSTKNYTKRVNLGTTIQPTCPESTKLAQAFEVTVQQLSLELVVCQHEIQTSAQLDSGISFLACFNTLSPNDRKVRNVLEVWISPTIDAVYNTQINIGECNGNPITRYQT